MSGFSIDDEAAPAIDGGSILGRLKRRISERAEQAVERVTARPQANPAFAITYRVMTLATEYALVVKMTEKARKKDPVADDRLLLARCCVGIAIDGVRVNADGEEWHEGDDDLTFASPALHEAIGLPKGTRAADAVTAVYRNFVEDGEGDGDIAATARDLLRRGGILDAEGTADVEPAADPT